MPSRRFDMTNSVLQCDLQHILSQLSPEERKKFSGATILVTGCAGFLGYTFMQFFRLYGEELGIRKVIGLDNFMLGEPGWLAPFRDDPRFELKRFDIIKDSISVWLELSRPISSFIWLL